MQMREEDIRFLERAYGCRVYGWKSFRNVWMVRTNRGYWVVKSYKDRELAELVTHLSERLRENGFFNTVQFVKGLNGKAVHPYQSRNLTVMKAINGKECHYASLPEMQRAVTTLARFHQAARGFPVELERMDGTPPLLDKWEHRLHQFEQIVSTVKGNGPKSRLEQLIVQMGPAIVNEGKQLLQQIHLLPLEREMHRFVVEGTLAHRDVASHNFLITDTQACYLIDLDTVQPDMQLVDLIQFAGRMLVMQGYNPDAFSAMIQAYCRIKPLSNTQVHIIHTMLRFHDNVMREVTGLYTRRRGFRARNVLQLLQLERRFWQNRKRFLGDDWQFYPRWHWSA